MGKSPKTMAILSRTNTPGQRQILPAPPRQAATHKRCYESYSTPWPFGDSTRDAELRSSKRLPFVPYSSALGNFCIDASLRAKCRDDFLRVVGLRGPQRLLERIAHQYTCRPKIHLAF